MVIAGAHSDRTGERRWHVAVPALVGSLGLVLSAFLTDPVMSLASLCLAALGIWSALRPFWTLPTAFLSGTAEAAGIALINSIGNLGGFVGPSLVGIARNLTQSFRGGLVALALMVCVSAVLALCIRSGASTTGTDKKV